MKIGFIGCGNMANAMIKGMISSNVVEASDVIVSNRTQPALDKAKESYHVQITLDNKEAAKADVVFLCVKPKIYPTVIDEIKQEVNENQVIVSIAPGITLENIESQFGKAIKLVRTMPNTPAMVLEGMTAMVCNDAITDNEKDYVKSLLSSFGQCAEVSESLMDVVTSVSGSSPAYVYMFIEAMADAAVHDGMPRNQAYQFAAQAVLGSAKMVLETRKHPGELKDMVCSPGGTTIEAVAILEEKGMRSAVIEAMLACTKKSKGE